MKLIISILVVLASTHSAKADESLNCPDETFSGTSNESQTIKTKFCQKWVEVGGGMLDAPKKELVLHGPYEVYEEYDPNPSIFRYRLVKTGQFKDGKAIGSWTEFSEDGKKLATYEMNEKSQRHGPYEKFHPNGAIRGKGQFENDVPVGVWQFFDPSGKKLAEGTQKEIQEVAAKFDQENEALDKAEASKKQLAQKNEQNLVLATIKKNWSTKSFKGSTLHYSFRDKLLVSNYLGFMGWFAASSNCRNQGMRLPTLEEGISLSTNGLCSIVLDQCPPFWTNTSRHNDKDPQRNMIVGKGAWMVLGGKGMPEELTNESGAICVK